MQFVNDYHNRRERESMKMPGCDFQQDDRIVPVVIFNLIGWHAA